MTEPVTAACMAVVEMMTVGSDTDGQADNWRRKDVSYHLLKANTHLGEAMRQNAGISKSDEEHLKLAITRPAMALALD